VFALGVGVRAITTIASAAMPAPRDGFHHTETRCQTDGDLH